MKEHNRHIEHLTPALIKAYNNGTLDKSQRHQVEKLMLESDLFEEGTEGLESLASLNQLDAHLNDLTQRIDDRVNEDFKSVFWTNTRKWAAAVTLIIISTLTYQLSKVDPPTKELTELQKDEKKENTKLDITDSTSADDTESLNTKAADSTSGRSLMTGKTAEDMADEDEDEILLDFAVEEEHNEVTELVAGDTKTKTDLSEGDLGSERNIEDALLAKTATSLTNSRRTVRANPALIRTINGKVFDRNDSVPLSSVTILEDGTNNMTTSNLQGAFTMKLSRPDSKLSARFLGYRELVVEVPDTSFLTMAMEPETVELDEVLVTSLAAERDKASLGYSIDSAIAPVQSFTNAARIEQGALDSLGAITIPKRKSNSYPTDRKAIPSGGHKAYSKYLKDNLVYPEQAKSERVRGRVVVEFTVMEDGSTANHKIIKSLGFGCDEEAIRLIKEGSVWQPKIEGRQPVKTVIKRTIRFKPK